MNRLKKFLKEYYGLVPVAGGMALAGIAGMAAYSVGFAQDISRQIQYITSTGDVFGGIISLYESASSTAGKCVAPAFVAGQFMTYRLKKSLISLFK